MGDAPRATDRRQLAKLQEPKTSKWPRTDRRVARLTAAIERRQPDLTVVLENVHDAHNVSAVLRSCDGVGIQRVHAVYTDEEPPTRSFARTTSASASKWIDVVRHDSLAACFNHLRGEGLIILATSLSETSTDLYETDLRGPTAIIVGNEMRGVSEEAQRGADGVLSIPMMGMVESLNISVACAVILYEALRQRRDDGQYEDPKLASPDRADLIRRWLQR